MYMHYGLDYKTSYMRYLNMSGSLFMSRHSTIDISLSTAALHRMLYTLWGQTTSFTAITFYITGFGWLEWRVASTINWRRNGSAGYITHTHVHTNTNIQMLWCTMCVFACKNPKSNDAIWCWKKLTTTDHNLTARRRNQTLYGLAGTSVLARLS